ncbi:cyclodeaminase/cyclohydrolase family protein [Niallia sp. XMNu-256]|uniref:cyclodeaminase/cyclohydrolase family protein n=1 Tax=Niallia sp. XMNu-256 TaxID=3082444 RepID=UPI0030CE8820
MNLNRIDELTVYEYLEKLASPEFPNPASGSAASTIAAMAASLLEMSYKVTVTNNEKKMPISLNEIEGIRHQCMRLATEDMIALAEVVKATKFKSAFPVKYEEAMKKATDPLVSVVKNCEIILSWIVQLIPIANKSVLGELAGSANMAEAAATSAKQGIEVNLLLLSDKVYIGNVQAAIHKSYKNTIETKQRIDKSMI